MGKRWVKVDERWMRGERWVRDGSELGCEVGEKWVRYGR